MKRIVFAAALLLPLTSCITVHRDKTDYPRARAISAACAEARVRVPMTFSVNIQNASEEIPIPRGLRQGDFERAALRTLTDSGLFSSVRCVAPEQAGPHHLTFDIIVGREINSLGLNFLLRLPSICSALIIPSWHTDDLVLTMTAVSGKKQLIKVPAQHAITKCLWLPLVLSAPFWTDGKATEELRQAAMQYFCSELRRVTFD